MAKFIKKPVEIDAVRRSGYMSDIAQMASNQDGIYQDALSDDLVIETLEGVMTARVTGGDS